jgi:sugar/nucleoside kinase (ribokinase family)
MLETPIDVLGIGNAIVDVLAKSGDDFLQAQGLVKGTMTLIDGRRADALYDVMGPALEMSGGSAANTMVGIAALGGRAAFIGRVRDDQFGRIFGHDIRAAGVTFDSAPATVGDATARCLVFVTADAQRTMATCLGVSTEFGPEDVREEQVRAAAVTYLEGYLWDSEPAKQAFLKAAALAHDAERQVALTLSDPFCVERHRESFRDLVEGHVDILFANEAEILSLYQVDNFDAALQAVREHCAVAALTRSEKGSMVVADGEVHLIDAQPVAEVVDTTGAGDLYAAGFLHGFTRGQPLYDCGVMGAAAAAEIIAHYGARPEHALKDLVAARLGDT